MIEQVNEFLEAIIADENIFHNTAKMMRKLYKALLAEGFTEEQATKIVANYSLSS